jgi:LacI family transcriptional regulator, repressor for deo operon, udp, cdd, tsx, nupC, and nupG
MAIGFMKAVRSAGVHVPANVSVMGFDGIAFADFCDPTLSVIKQPFFEIGSHAAKLLLQLMQGRSPSSLKLLHDCDLLARDSPAPAPHR